MTHLGKDCEKLNRCELQMELPLGQRNHAALYVLEFFQNTEKVMLFQEKSISGGSIPEKSMAGHFNL